MQLELDRQHQGRNSCSIRDYCNVLLRQALTRHRGTRRAMCVSHVERVNPIGNMWVKRGRMEGRAYTVSYTVLRG
jgi:hypothetical protein